MFETMNNVISWIDGAVWGLPLIILILCTGIYLSVSMGFLQIRHLGKALKFMVKNEEGGKGSEIFAPKASPRINESGLSLLTNF